VDSWADICGYGALGGEDKKDWFFLLSLLV
jgi:hypothetical protein